MKSTTFQEAKFRDMVDKALQSIRRVLDVNRNPTVAGDDDSHSYNDKYALTELLTNTAIAANMNVLERIGITQEKLTQLHSMVVHDKKTVTLRMEAQDTCQFLQEKVVQVVSHTSEGEIHTETTKSGVLFGKSTKKETHKYKVVNKVKEYHWKVGINYKIFCYAGSDPTKNIVPLQNGSNSAIIATTGSSNPPLSEKTVANPYEVCINWILQNININLKDKQWTCAFKIDRSNDKCRTPRRNEDIDKAADFFRELEMWEAQPCYFLVSRVQDRIMGCNNPVNNPTKKPYNLRDLSQYHQTVFCPVVPLMENRERTAGTATFQQHSLSLLVTTSPHSSDSNNDNSDGGGISPLLATGDIDKLLNEQCRSLDKAMTDISSLFPPQQQTATDQNDSLISLSEARLCLLMGVGGYIGQCWFQSIDYIEHLLVTQLKAAIGKEIKPKDFDEFMTFHNRRLFAPQYQPKPFCYAIRRPNHYPDGLLTIESSASKDDSIFGGGNKDKELEPCFTFTRHISGDSSPSISIPLNAATTIEMKGDRYLHGWMHHKFGSESPTRGKPTLAARARQFSCFLLMVGTMSGPNSFRPKDAIILQNKDEVLIPLLLEDLPSAKEFKDAISSLSPEQQRFAKSFRGMQLASSVFGVCVMQLKPQLELLLGLPNESLTKEIELTQDLMSLFMDYQIPSDLLSYDGNVDATLKDKVNVVKDHVKNVMGVIEKTRKKELEETKNQAEMNVYQSVADVDYMERRTAAQPYSAPMALMSMAMPVAAPPPPSGGLFGASALSSGRFGAPAPSSGAPVSFGAPFGAPAPSSGGFGAPAPGGSVFGSAPAPTPPRPAEQPKPAADAFFDESSTEQTTTMTTTNETGLDNVDFTSIPKKLDAILDNHDKDGALRSTILKAIRPWKRQRQENLLSKPTTTDLDDDKCREERNKAFDLLDALSRSGSLPISCAELHVIVAVTHQFEHDMMETVIQDNINPIEKVEQSLLLLVSTIQGIEIGGLTPTLLSADYKQVAQNLVPLLLDV